MAKTKRRWIELDYTNPNALRAEDIPYDATMSTRDAIVGLSVTGVQGPAGTQGATGLSSGPMGDTGIQGITGLGDLQPGVTGIQGIQGITGLIGIQGTTGIRGLTGFQGVTGVVLPSAMPSAYATLSTAADATSSSFADIPNLYTTINLDSTGQLFATMSFETESLGAGSYPTGSFRIVFSPGPSGPGDSTGTELEKYLLPDDVSLGSVTHYAGPYTGSGTVTVKGQFRRVSGQQKVRVNNAQIYAQSLIGGKGDMGNPGATGVQGLGVTGLQGILGSTGLYGPTGLQGGGETGIRGMTGMGIQGSTGIRGVTGPQGYQGVTGVASLVSPPSSFIYFDSTTQLYDNTSTFIDIPGLSTTFTIDTSGVYAYSSMTILADSTSSPLGAGYVKASMRIVIDDQTSLEYQRYVQNDFDLNSNTFEFRTAALADGTHSAKGQILITDTTGDNKYFVVRKAQLFVQGLEGSAGPEGPMGPRGYDGATGIQGSTGIRGTTGIQGLRGYTGIQGLGVTGLQGATGFFGETGLFGDTGVQGNTGIQGLGVTGLQGMTGISGVTGFYGHTGVQGNIGNTGILGTTGIQGVTGLSGTTGIQGVTGVYGQTGIQGVTGFYDQTGVAGNTGIQGVTGVYGQTGIQGVTGIYGLTGVQGITGIHGQTGIMGVTGLQGYTGFYGQTGIQGITGFYGQTGVQGNSTQILFNPISRYEVVNTSGAEVWLSSSSAVYHGLPWDRTGTTMNIYRTSHGHAAGNRVIVRNTNKDYQTATIDTTTANSFAITTTLTDGTVGYFGAYSLGFTYAHDGIPSSAGVVSAPSGDHSDCQLISARIRTGNRTGTTYALTVPASAVNGAGANTSLSDCYIPDFNVRTDSDTLSAVAATMITNVGSSYSTFEFGNLGSGSISRMILVHF